MISFLGSRHFLLDSQQQLDWLIVQVGIVVRLIIESLQHHIVAHLFYVSREGNLVGR